MYHSTLGLRVIKKKTKKQKKKTVALCQRRDLHHPLSSEYDTCKTDTARFWPWLSGRV